MSAAKVNGTKVTILDGRADPAEIVTEQDVQDASKLARGLGRVARDLAGLLRRFNPSRVDFEDVAVGAAGASVTLEHRFSGRVRWWLVGWQATGTTAPILKEDTTNSTSSALVLLSYVAGTACIRVEAAG